MLRRLTSLADGSSQVFRAEGGLLLVRLRRMLAVGGLALAGGVLVLLAVVGLFAAAAVALAGEVGGVQALAIVSGGALVLGLCVIVAARVWMGRAMRRRTLPREQRRDAAEGYLKMQGATPMMTAHTGTGAGDEHGPIPSGGPAADGDLKDRVLRYAAENPAVTASGAFALLSLIGPMRAFRLVGRGMMLASVVAAVREQARQQGGARAGAGEGHESRTPHAGMPPAPPR